jgi:hypothetical protein
MVAEKDRELMQKSAKLFLHVGPPKTATTSLQFSLQSGSDSFEYLGVSQPRGIKEQEVAAELHHLVGSNELDSKRVEETLSQVHEAIESNKHVLISEEMFLVDGAITHQEKLKRLSVLLKDVSVEAVITLRNPIDGLPSLYQELYRSLPLRQQRSFEAFTKSNQAKVFDYEHLVDVLNDCFGTVKVLSFDELVSEKLMLSDLFGREENNDRPISMKKINSGAIEEEGRVVAPIQAGKLLTPARRIPAPLLNRLKTSRWIQFCWNKVKNISIVPQTTKQLTVPESLADELIRKWTEIKNRPTSSGSDAS